MTSNNFGEFLPGWIGAGDYLGFYFRADVQPDEWGSNVYWEINHITVYAYGAVLSLEQNTWGAIKASLN